MDLLKEIRAIKEKIDCCNNPDCFIYEEFRTIYGICESHRGGDQELQEYLKNTFERWKNCKKRMEKEMERDGKG